MILVAALAPWLLGASLVPPTAPCAAQEAGKAAAEVQRSDKGAPTAEAATIRRLIDQLGSTDSEVRETATMALSRLDDVPELLREATKSDDAEVRRRAQIAIDAITVRVEERAYQAMVANLQKVDLDRFVRRMVTDENFASVKKWQVVQVIARAVTRRVADLSGQQILVPAFDIAAMPLADRTRPTGLRGMRALIGESNEPLISVRDSVVLCTGSVPRVTMVSNSIMIVDGDFPRATVIENSLLIVRGNIGPVSNIRNSIILATGHMEGGTVCDNSFIQISNNQIRLTRANGSVLIKTQIRTTGATTSRVLNVAKGPLQILKFSDRKPDEQLAWGKPVNGLAVALAPTEDKHRYLIRWKNVGNESLQLPWVRLNYDVLNKSADDLLNHVLLKSANGDTIPAREYPPPAAARPLIGGSFVLGPGKVLEETIDLWTYVKKPTGQGGYRLSIELDMPTARRVRDLDVPCWTGKVRSNELEITLP
jgi:hypothetical protein